MKNKAFTLNNENSKPAIGIEVTFILEIKSQKVHVLEKHEVFGMKVTLIFEIKLQNEQF